MVTVGKRVMDELVRYCSGVWPEEACGVLWGCSDGEHVSVARFEGVRNASATPARSFQFEPEVWTRIIYSDEKGSDSLVGVFHSHPTGGVLPSAADSETAWRFPTYWIVSFAGDGGPQLYAYRMNADGTADGQTLQVQ